MSTSSCSPDVQQNYPGEWGSEDERITDAATKLGALAEEQIAIMLTANPRRLFGQTR